MTASTRIFRCETHLLVDQAIVVARTSLQIIVHNTCHIHIKPRCRCCLLYLPRRLHAVTYATTHHMAATRNHATVLRAGRPSFDTGRRALPQGPARCRRLRG